MGLAGNINEILLVIMAGICYGFFDFYEGDKIIGKLKKHDRWKHIFIFSSLGIINAFREQMISFNSMIQLSMVLIIIVGIMGGIELIGVVGGIIIVYKYGIGENIISIVGLVFAAFISGSLSKWMLKRKEKWIYCVGIRGVVGFIQIGVIIWMQQGGENTETYLFYKIGFNMVGDMIAIAIVMLIAGKVAHKKEIDSNEKVKRVLTIATKTLPSFRKGLKQQTAQTAVESIHEALNIDGVQITDCEKILFHGGEGNRYFYKGKAIDTWITEKAMKNNTYLIAQEQSDITKDDFKYSLKSMIVVPLTEGDKVVGSLKFYRKEKNGISMTDIELAKGIAGLFSTQLELSQLERQQKLLNKAEINALQAQIQPHFIFNVLNTIMSFCRIDPEVARQLLLNLSMYLRLSFKNTEEFVSLQKEIERIQAYLFIERARFLERLKVIYEIERGIDCKLPPFILQPIVENAVKHGLGPKEEGGIIRIGVYQKGDYVIIEVEDNGVGMEQEQIRVLLQAKNSKKGIGVSNVNQRLKSIYGERLKIESELGKGTKVIVPILKNQQRGQSDDSSNNS